MGNDEKVFLGLHIMEGPTGRSRKSDGAAAKSGESAAEQVFERLERASFANCHRVGYGKR